MKTIEVNKWRQHEEIARIVDEAFPSYRRQKVYINPTGNVTFHDLNWSGGTRSEYVALTLEGERCGDMSTANNMAPWANPVEGKSVDIPKGMCVVQGGYFCGKPSTLTLYINPADVGLSLT